MVLQMAEILTITGDPRNDDPHIARVADMLRHSGIVAIPTETVYGLAANALDEAAIQKIYAAKGRPATNPLIVHVASADEAKELASSWPQPARLLADAFWPGPLTLVVPKKPIVPDAATAGLPSVAVRVPAHPVMRAVISAAGVPLAAPSANVSEGVSPTRAEHVLKSLGESVDLVLDAGPTEHGLESTVVDCIAVPPRILRHGPISVERIRSVIGDMASADSVVTDDIARLSPGQSQRHYAPRARVVLADAASIAEALSVAERPVGALVLDTALQDSSATIVHMPPSSAEYGAVLYTELHRLDDARAATIVVEMPPDEPGWEAVRDRLQRASA